MKISARNQIHGTITEVHKGATTADVLIDVGGATLTASITNEAVDRRVNRSDRQRIMLAECMGEQTRSRRALSPGLPKQNAAKREKLCSQRRAQVRNKPMFAFCLKSPALLIPNCSRSRRQKWQRGIVE
jgi:hypothetical protein